MPKQKIDCLFIHAPCDTSGAEISVMHMAMGVLALADLLQKNNYSSKIIHLGVEKIENSAFSIENYLKNKKIRSVGISLHWHYQSKNCMRLARKIKNINPRLKIFLGGFTASYFADAIMKKFNNIDFIIRGDAEVPILRLIKKISENKSDFSAIPNLSWRANGRVIHNEHNYSASEAAINKLNFSNFKLMENFSVYSKAPADLLRYSKSLLKKYSTLFLCVGRGCPVNCSFCGGSSLSQKIINKRNNVIFRSQENVLQTIEDAIKAGIEQLYVCFDPYPDREYYIKLFRAIQRKKIRISMAFECWSLPDQKFIDEFSRTFGKGTYSKIVLSPETASEKLRQLHKGFFYTNSELLSALQYLKKKSIAAEIYFSYPLPRETLRDVNNTIHFIKLIKKKLGNGAKTLVRHFGFDPASPMSLCPAKYKITQQNKSFADYCNIKKSRNFLLQGLSKQRFQSLYKKWMVMNKANRLLFQSTSFFTLRYYKEAIRKARSIKKLDCKEIGINVHPLLGFSYEKIRQYRRAIEELKMAEKLNPLEPEINFSLSNCYRNIGQREYSDRELLKGFIKLKNPVLKTTRK